MSSMGIEALAGATTMPTLPTVPTVGGADTSLSTGATGSTDGTTGAGGDFGHLLVNSLDQLESISDKASDLSVKAATGDLNSIHDYTIAATEAQTATQLTVAVRNKAVDAFNEIMRMSV
jgi:flagellar hook-basal body complex protein FliE